ncbi:MAG: allantoinase AllB [Vicinamibacterales bacterium]
MSDLVVRGGTIVTAAGLIEGDVLIENGRIAAIAPGLTGAGREVDARGLLVMPGIIDVHLHFNEPGRTEWEGAATGSRALAAGGGTLFFDMPLNSTPCTVTVDAFDRKREALEASSITDFGIWGGLIPGSVSEMEGLAERGCVGFKAFMCDSGLAEFPRADDVTLLDGMREAARLGVPVAVHAESHDLTRGLGARMAGTEVHAFLASRPVIAELDAIHRALLLAEETGAMLHIVHVSSGRGVALAADARRRGVNVSIETCPHYLYFTEEDVIRLGAVAKCAPPVRSGADREALWLSLLMGHIDIVASDHSPAEPAMKAGDFAAAWGGIAGVQSTLAVLAEQGHHARGLTWSRIAELLAAGGARRFRIAGKGAIEVGFDADMTLVDPNGTFTLQAGDLLQRHKMSPYIGRTFRGAVRRTIRRGETIFADGAITAVTPGRLVRPARPTATT